MRFARLAVMLAACASRAWAQPAEEAPAPPSEAPEAAPDSPPSTASPSTPADTGAPATPEPATDPAIDPATDPAPVSPAAPDSSASEPVGAETPFTISPPRNSGFRFGSYGRVLAGSDLRGGKPEKVLVVAHGPRIVESSYLELDFSYGFETQRGLELRPVVTLAFDGTLFHDTGEFDAQPALRNVFLEGKLTKHVSAWVGSRMYRGDDIYLFDYWPLDDQNTVGGGVMVKHGPLELAAHVGFNRLLHPFQYQEIDVPNPVQGATTVEQLNRQRTVASATAAYIAENIADDIHAKLKVHGETHSLPAGTRERTDGTLESLPSDSGFVIGAQVGVYGFAAPESKLRRHVNVFTRYAKGLAAFDELAPPTSFGRELKTTRANEITVGLSANWDHARGNLMIGALSRRFIDADENTNDPDDGWEYAIDARPLVRVISDWFVGADVSYQARFPKGLNAITLRAEDPAVFQIAPMLAWSPMGPSGYDRPQLRLVYRAAHLNEGARNLYVPDDPRHDREWVHFLGLQAEWWFNSSTYR